MVIIKNLQDVRQLPDYAVKRAMETCAFLVHNGEADIVSMMEEEFNGSIGGEWYIFEPMDDPRNMAIGGGDPVDLLSEEWNWCDTAEIYDGCYFIFWGTNNAGGPCLFVPDETWIPTELRARLNDLVSSSTRWDVSISG